MNKGEIRKSLNSTGSNLNYSSQGSESRKK